MGQKVNAVGMRVGINRDWNSKWYANNQEYSSFLHEDLAIRKYLDVALKDAVVSHIDIFRKKTDKGHDVKVQAFVARPGVVLGQDGANINKVRKELSKLVKSGSVKIDVVPVENPDLDATLVARWIVSELENRASYRATQKKAIRRMRKAGAKGCRTLCSGRLGGAEIAREEGYKEGVVPLHTLRADIDFAHVDAHTPYGRVGVKVWCCKSLNKAEESAKKEEAPKKGRGERNHASTETR
ncbi:MAG: 30S ribosomal protein S3 [Bacillota bacterium]|nr:30S ribosomal protein S3 [Bacillota bacterium]